MTLSPYIASHSATRSVSFLMGHRRYGEYALATEARQTKLLCLIEGFFEPSNPIIHAAIIDIVSEQATYGCNKLISRPFFESSLQAFLNSAMRGSRPWPPNRRKR